MLTTITASHIAIDRHRAGEDFDRILATSSRACAETISIVNPPHCGSFGDNHLNKIAYLHMMGKKVFLLHNREEVSADVLWLESPIP